MIANLEKGSCEESTDNLMEFLRAQAPAIYRDAQGCLKHPFLVPGGLFHDELWDWDSFWIVEGLSALYDSLDPIAQDSFLSHARGSWINFFEHQAVDGALPIMLKAEGGDFFGCTAVEDGVRNQGKPVFAQLGCLVAKLANDYSWMHVHYEHLKKFHQRWRSRYSSHCGLLVWGSDAAIGVDNDPTTYGRPEFSSANLMLNALFHQDLHAIAEIASELGYKDDAREFVEEADLLKQAILRECWDEIDGFFYTVDVQVRDHRPLHFPNHKRGMDTAWQTVPIKIKMFTGFLPLWAGIATEDQARILVEQHLKNPEEFAARYGIRSLAKNEKMYRPAVDTANPSNWTGPAWILANYMIYKGLVRYGYTREALDLAKRTTDLLNEDLQRTGCLHECYHPDTGQPNFNDDFLSWNVLVAAMR